MLGLRIEFDVYCHCGQLLTQECSAGTDKGKHYVTVRTCQECVTEELKKEKNNE